MCPLLWKLSHYNWIRVQIGTPRAQSRKGLFKIQVHKNYLIQKEKLQSDFKLCNYGEEEEMFTEAFKIS